MEDKSEELRKGSDVPVLEEAAKAKSHQLQRRLDHKGGGEEVVAVLQCRLQGLRERRPAEFRA